MPSMRRRSGEQLLGVGAVVVGAHWLLRYVVVQAHGPAGIAHRGVPLVLAGRPDTRKVDTASDFHGRGTLPTWRVPWR
ncbi:hypothetical protein CRM89_29520 [Nocardia sp. FDAARGOS_372]|nr:hypothetical protein CRM89_29520 [Nocardia sp. FDAARGOS_372]